MYFDRRRQIAARYHLGVLDDCARHSPNSKTMLSSIQELRLVLGLYEHKDEPVDKIKEQGANNDEREIFEYVSSDGQYHGEIIGFRNLGVLVGLPEFRLKAKFKRGAKRLNFVYRGTAFAVFRTMRLADPGIEDGDEVAHKLELPF